MQVPEVKGEVQKESLWGSRMRYAKIGAAAVGGGALLAVTGDIIIIITVSANPKPEGHRAYTQSVCSHICGA